MMVLALVEELPVDLVFLLAIKLKEDARLQFKLACRDFTNALGPSRTSTPAVHVTKSLPLLQWARANGCAWDANTCALAAENGHLDVLQWARANGCEWDANTCSCAARGGHLDVLRWARANGCALCQSSGL